MSTSNFSSGNQIPPMKPCPTCGVWHGGDSSYCFSHQLMKYTLLILTLFLASCASQPATCVAIRPMSQAPAGTDSLWAYNRDFWPQKSTLRVKFIEGSKSQQDNAWRRFQKVDALVNLTFVRVPSGEAEIRVGFDPQGGHWSYVGKYCAKIPQAEKTMNLALTGGVFGDRSNEWDRVAIHETLHAIGFQHEHQSPQNTIKWNVPVVLAEYRASQGWSDAEIYDQVLNRSDAKDFNGTAFDPKSIMEYPISAKETLDGFSVGWNRKLTETDIATIRRIYPQ